MVLNLKSVPSFQKKKEFQKVIPVEKDQYAAYHHVSLGHINPKNEFQDPRKNKNNKHVESIKPEPKKIKLVDRAFSAKVFKKSIPEICENSFIYVNKLVPRYNKTDHPDIWNNSPHPNSKRRQYSLDKSRVTELTETVRDVELQFKDRKPTAEEFKMIYADSEVFKKTIQTLFEDVNDAIKNQSYSYFMGNKIANNSKNIQLMDLIDHFCKNNNVFYGKKITKNEKNEEEIQWVNMDIEIEQSKFTNFFIQIGLNYDKKKLDKIFQLTLQQPSAHELHNNQVPKNKELLSMKAFNYNFTKYFKDKARLKQSTSSKQGILRQNDLYDYLQNWFKGYAEFKEQTTQIQADLDKSKRVMENFHQENVQIQIQNWSKYFTKREPTKEEISMQEARQLTLTKKQKRREFIDKLKYEFGKSLILKIKKDEIQLPNQSIKEFQNLVDRKSNSFFEKRILTKFLSKLEKNSLDNPISVKILEEFYQIRQSAEHEMLEVQSKFVHEFKKEKIGFKEQEFTLFEITNYLFEKKYDRQSLNYVGNLISKLKKFFNLHEGMDKNTPIEPNQPIDIEYLTQTFNMVCDKAQFANDILTAFIESSQDLLDNLFQQKKPMNKIVITNFEQNVLSDFILKYLKSIDNNMMNSISKLIDITKFILYGGHFQENQELSLQSIANKINGGQNTKQQVKIAQPSNDEDFAISALNTKRVAQNLVGSPSKSNEQIAQRLVGSSTKINDIYSNNSFLQQQNIQKMPLTQSHVYNDEMSNTNNTFNNNSFNNTGRSVNFKLPEKNDNMSQSQLLMSIKKMSSPLKNPQLSENNPLKSTITTAYVEDNKLKLGNYQLKSDKFSEFQVLMPKEYYNFILDSQKPKENQWFIRPHHIETITEHPLSLKDNILGTKYNAFYEEIPIKERPEIKQLAEKIQPKQQAIEILEAQLAQLKNQVNQRSNKALNPSQENFPRHSIQNNIKIMQNYYGELESKNDKELLHSTYNTMLMQLRQREVEILNQKRERQLQQVGPPQSKWWEIKDKTFNPEMKKYSYVTGKNADQHLDYISKLQINELY